jgi:ABC-type nitrate/sulfonate/bicarbonate transport system permease component
MGRKLKFFVPITIFLLGWEMITRLPFMPEYLFPPFSVVLKRFIIELGNGRFVENMFFTVFRVFTGFALGAVSGILFGIFAGIDNRLNDTMSPLIFLLYPIPSIGWIPVLMIWFGISNAVPIIAVLICSFFPIYMNTMRGVKNVDKSIINAARIMGSDKITLIKSIILPLAMPNIFTGLKLESGMSLRTGVVAEMLAIPSGLGYMLMKGESLIDVPLMFSILLAIAILSVIFDFVMRLLEKKVLKWQN